MVEREIEELAIGKFDGMHVGHQSLFKELGENGAILVIDNGSATLTPNSLKQEIINKPVFVTDLDAVRDVEGEDFIANLTVTFPRLRKIIVGYDFRFGKDRRYCAQDIARFFTGESVVKEEVKVDNISVHSGIIKELLYHGDIAQANKLLGRAFAIEGKHIRGQGIGATQLVATINLDCDGYLIPSEGIYATRSRVDGKVLDSVTFVGHRYSTDRAFSVETHILDEKIEIQNDTVRISFYEKLRDNRLFDSLEALKVQIGHDIVEAKKVLANVDR